MGQEKVCKSAQPAPARGTGVVPVLISGGPYGGVSGQPLYVPPSENYVETYDPFQMTL